LNIHHQKAYDYPLKNRIFSIGQKNDEYEITDLKALAEVCDALIRMKRENKYIYITNLYNKEDA
jgi:hypothetical protein